LWQLQLLECLYAPMSRYPLPCMSHHMYANGTGTIPLDYDPANPAILCNVGFENCKSSPAETNI
jgi:hypothetical protein